MQGNHEQRNQQVNLPLFSIEMMTTRMTCESLKRGRGEVKSGFPFLLFQISFISFLFIYFIKCKGEQKQICSGKGEKKMVDLGVRVKNSNENGGRRVEKKMG
jgi:hypothetical protein